MGQTPPVSLSPLGRPANSYRIITPPSIKFVSQSRRDRNVPTIVVMENITTTDRRDFPDTVGEYGVSAFGRAKLPLSHWVTKVRQWASPSHIPNPNEFANSIWKVPSIGCRDILHSHDSRDIPVPTALGHKLYAWIRTDRLA